MTYFIADEPTPIFNTKQLEAVFGRDSGRLQVDKAGHVRALEMIAFSGTHFEVCAQWGEKLLQVTTTSYPVDYPLFIDRRFGTITTMRPPQKGLNWPPRARVLERLESAVGIQYIWGGNVREGLPTLLTYYPPPADKNLTSLELTQWTFCGLDCSGLLYEATAGITPRNTANLLFYGQAVCIEGLEITAMATLLQPLDLIVYRGHVVIVLPDRRAIESRDEAGGVVVCCVKNRLQELHEEGRLATDDPKVALRSPNRFVVRRPVQV